MKPKRIKKKWTQFSIRVDADLLKRANAARKKTWVELTEQMLHYVIELAEDEKAK